jgi:PAS domain S-box-containing protein
MSRLSSTLAHARSDPDITLAVLFDVGNRVVVSTDYLLRDRTVKDTPFAPLANQMASARAQHTPTAAHLTADDRVLIVPVSLGGSTAPASAFGRGLLVLSSSTRYPVAAATAAARRRMAVVTVILLLSTLLAWLLFNRMLLSRMRHLSAAAQQVGRGNLQANFTLPGSDELALLGSTLARMTSQLRAHADEIRGSRSALEESHERFAAVAKATNDIIWDWDPRTERVWRSNAVRTLLGYDVGDSSERLDWLRHVAPADHARVEASFRAALASDATSWSCEYELRRADGTAAYILDRAIIVRDDSGRPVRMVGAMTDLTAQRRAEESHSRLASILQASPDFVGTADAVTLRVTWINKAGRRMVGLGDDEDVSHLTVHDFQPTWVLESLLDEMIAVAKTGGMWAGESAMRHRDGHEIPVLKTVVAHRRQDGQAEYISTVARDIRERKQLEAQLLQAQKMESIGRLAGGVAHDFNNMLTAIIGYTELAKAQLPDDHAVQQDLDNVNDAARRSAALTRQLLAFARKQVISPRAVDLNDLIGRIDTMLNRLLGEDIRLITKRTTGLAPVLIDPGQFEQVLMNLAVNARDAMPHGGTLTVETADAHLDEGWCQHHPGATPGDYGLVRVGDTGVGMSPEVMAHLFEPFFTTKPSGEGTGLGLAMCYGIVKQSGGTIWVSSEPGRGTTFDIYLPRFGGAPTADGWRPASAPAVKNAGHETILLVEDEAVVRDLAYRALSACGYRILTAVDGPDAVEIARNHHGSIDLVLSDVVMPHMGVAELSTKLRQHRPRVRLLFMSGYSETAVHSHGVIQAGAGLIEKPFTPESLARQVREALDVTA